MLKSIICVVILIQILIVMVEEAIYFENMFQLNGYHRNEFWSWIYKNRYVYLGKEFPVLLALLCTLTGTTVGMIFAVLFLLPAISTNRVRVKRKPLVYTARVKRMLVTLACVELLVLVLVLLLVDLYAVVIAGMLLLCVSPFLVLLADFINKPIEYGVKQYYINDAKKILKSMDGLKIIGVTGSFGKTSVKNFLKTLLSAKYNVLMTPLNYNTPMGIVKTVRTELKPIHEIFICEMGARYVGDIKEDCDIAKPDLGVLTAIGYQHLETFGSIDNIIKTKYELAEAIPADGKLFVNADNEFIMQNREKYASHLQVVTYAKENQEAEFFPYDIALSEKGTTFKMDFPEGNGTRTAAFQTKLIGTHNILNIAGAIAVAYHLGVKLEDIILQVRKLEPVEHRLQMVVSTEKKIVIDDAYNSNPTGAAQALEVLNVFEGCKILVSPGMVELGEKEYELNKQFAANATGVCDYIICVGRKRAKPFEDAVAETGYPAERFYVATGLKDAMAYAENIASQQRKVILLENDLPDNY